MVQKVDQLHDAVLLVRDLQQGKLVEHLVDSMDEFRFVWTWPKSKLLLRQQGTKKTDLAYLTFSSSVGL